MNSLHNRTELNERFAELKRQLGGRKRMQGYRDQISSEIPTKITRVQHVLIFRWCREKA